MDQENFSGLFMENSEDLCLVTDKNNVIDLVNSGSGIDATALNSQPSQNLKKRLKRSDPKLE